MANHKKTHSPVEVDGSFSLPGNSDEYEGSATQAVESVVMAHVTGNQEMAGKARLDTAYLVSAGLSNKT